MRTHNRSGALMTELLIVVMFFLLFSALLLQLFVAAKEQSVEAEQLNTAVREAQNTADRLYTAADPEQLLQVNGFEEKPDGTWRCEANGVVLCVSFGTQGTSEAGLPGDHSEQQDEMLRATVTALDTDGEELLTLPVARWKGAAA